MATKKTTGTPKTETIIGTAASKLSKAVSDAKSVLEQVTGLEAIVEENTLKVTDLQQRIENLSTEYSQKKAEQEFELDLSYKTDKKEFAEKYLQEENLVAIPQEK